jgi:hydroxymethylbilane synthase
MNPTLRIGARGSLLSLKQTQLVASHIQKLHPGLSIEIIPIKTTGDVIQDRPLADIGGKGLFTREIQRALLDGRIDLAVHSFKDLPITQPLVDPLPLCVAATLPREDPRDLIVSAKGHRIDTLPKNATVGTSSLRRKAQLLEIRPDLQIRPLRGNIDTRVKKALNGEFDAIILAYAGMIRSGLFCNQTMIPIDPEQILPAPGQGALCLECRKNDASTLDRISPLNHLPTLTCVQIEREVVQLLNGDCHSPIAAMASICNQQITLKARVGMPQGNPPVREAEITTPLPDANEAPKSVLQMLIKKGVTVNPMINQYPDDFVQNLE